MYTRNTFIHFIEKFYLVAMSTISSYSYKELLDIATKIAVQAKNEYLTKSQIENLIGSLYMVDDPRDALLIAQLFSHRQAARLEKGFRTMSKISKILNDMYNTGKDRIFASQFLGLVKWIYECIEERRLPKVNAETITFDELMKILREEH
jgi:hypothetical protein